MPNHTVAFGRPAHTTDTMFELDQQQFYRFEGNAVVIKSPVGSRGSPHALLERTKRRVHVCIGPGGSNSQAPIERGGRVAFQFRDLFLYPEKTPIPETVDRESEVIGQPISSVVLLLPVGFEQVIDRPQQRLVVDSNAVV